MKRMKKNVGCVVLALLLVFSFAGSVLADVVTPDSSITTPTTPGESTVTPGESTATPSDPVVTPDDPAVTPDEPVDPDEPVTTPSDPTTPDVPPVVSNPDSKPVVSNPDFTPIVSNPDAPYVSDTDTTAGTVALPEVNYVSTSGTPERKVYGNGGEVAGSQDVIPAGSKFTGAAVTTGSTTYTTASTAVAKSIPNCTSFAVFEFNLSDVAGVQMHQLSGFVNVTAQLPKSLVVGEGETIVVYRLEADGVTLTRCESVVLGDYILFATDHFSTYVFAVEKADSAKRTSPKTGE